MVKPSFGVFALVLSAACHGPASAAPDVAIPRGADAALGDAHAEASPPPSTPDAGADGQTVPFVGWLRSHLPAGGSVEVGDGGVPRVFHTVAAGDTVKSVAEAYVGLTDIYAASDLASAMVTSDRDGGRSDGKPARSGGRAHESDRDGGLELGSRIEIPHIITAAVPDDPEAGRLGWPDDRALRGVFISGAYAAIRWVDTLDKLAARRLNAVVLDGKDYTGPVNYPTKVPVAVETGAYVLPNIPDLARAIRFAHDRGIRVIMRIACFHDPWAAKHAPRLSLMGNWGGPFPMGWLDPTNVEAQDYILGLVREEVAAGADEIQLDYVRFPIQSKGIHAAVMPKPDGSRSRAIRDFVKRVHEITQPKGVPLSLDIFGVAATGDWSDVHKLGQDIGVIGSEAEVLSPMVYPSEYSPGYYGFDQPGNHPEIVGIGTKAAIARLKAAKNDKTLIRSWLQASAYKSTNYGPSYLVKEAKSAEANGGTGWLLWNPGCDYWAAWRAFPVVAGPADAGR